MGLGDWLLEYQTGFKKPNSQTEDAQKLITVKIHTGR